MSAVTTFPPRRAPGSPPADRPVVDYPDSDGQPMAENDPQYYCITDTRFALQEYYREEPQVYVGADLLVYYVEGDPGKSVAPDVLASLGVPKHMRRYYLVWDEGKPPDVIFEFASPSTWRADLGWKRGLYLGLGVREYFLFDPTGEHFNPIFQGFRLAGFNYDHIAPLDGERGLLGLRSDVLGLELWARPNGDEAMPVVLRLYDPARAGWLPTATEVEAARRAAETAREAAEAHAAEEAAARHAAEARAAEVEAQLAQLQAELERLRRT